MTHKITTVQLFFLIMHTQVGIGLLTLPHDVYQTTGTGSWISILLGGLLIQIMIVIIWLLAKRFPDKTIFDIHSKLFGRVLGNFLTFLFCLYFLFTTVLIGLLTITALKQWHYPNTPHWIIAFLSLLTFSYFVRVNIQVLARYNVIISFVIIFLCLFILTPFSSNINADYLFPINLEPTDLMKGVNKVILSLLGFEFLMFAFPFVKGEPKKILKSASLVNAFVTLIYVALMIITMMFFTSKEIIIVKEPILYILKSLDWNVIERLDIFFLTAWLLTVNATSLNYMYLLVNGVSHIFHQKDHRKASNFMPFVNAVLIYLLFDPEKLEFLLKMMPFVSYLFIGVLPLTLLGIAVIKSTSERRKQL
ncbi:spore germination protein [Bacillus sp. Marseille-Q3570]|uniref:GerAB/ArcD/ProY family transporter n=1 Tax=Bacillus sp. Marseille-Q3570 TaxID=2963522 RepID=UPI0021B78A67|nr:spore germination protein [Bacillus sp. Marseille-Q3570]